MQIHHNITSITYKGRRQPLKVEAFDASETLRDELKGAKQRALRVSLNDHRRSFSHMSRLKAPTETAVKHASSSCSTQQLQSNHLPACVGHAWIVPPSRKCFILTATSVQAHLLQNSCLCIRPMQRCRCYYTFPARSHVVLQAAGSSSPTKHTNIDAWLCMLACTWWRAGLAWWQP